jgi:hypothetical protein
MRTEKMRVVGELSECMGNEHFRCQDVLGSYTLHFAFLESRFLALVLVYIGDASRHQSRL